MIEKILYIFVKNVGVLLLLLAISSSSYAFPYKDLDFKAQASISETYDDNINYRKDNREDDFITTLGLGFDVSYEGKRRLLGVDGQINRRFNARSSGIKDSSESMDINFKNQFSQYDELALQYLFTHSSIPASFEEALDRIVARRESFNHRVNLNYRRNISEHFNIRLRYGYRLEKFSEEIFRVDQYYNNLGLTINYKPGIENTYFLRYTYSQNKLNNVVNSLTLGTTRYLSKILYLNGEIGASFTSSKSSFTLTNNERSSPYADVALTAELDEISTAKLSFRRSDQFSSDRGDISTSWQIDGQYTRRFLERLDGSFSIYYGKNKFNDSNDKNTLLGVTGQFTYAFLEDLTGNLSYTYTNLDSTDKFTGYSKNTLLIGLTKIF